ncbi:MAG TPA: ABC transporter substrate-binding protein [Thermoanaerobaculia bacterium]|nr:ABC transporter substrate-binding protein [Thermoanaerobaculia bacterium]
MRRNLLKIFTIIAVVLLAGCPPKNEAGGGGAAGAGGGDILIGEYGSLTGPQATFGTSTHNAIIMAMDEINAAGGVNGRKIKVLTEDDQSKQEEAANAVTKLISENNVLAVLGEVASSCSLAAAPICQSNKVPMITPSSTNPEVTRKGDYIFRTCFTDDYQGENIARYAANELHYTRAAILTDVKNDYSTGLTAIIGRVFTSLGGQIVAQQSYSAGDSDFRSQLTAIRAANPEVIFVPGYYTDVGQIAIQARDLGMKQPLMGGDGWESPKLLEIGGQALNGCMYTNHYFYGDPSPIVRDFVSKYKQRYGSIPDGMAALGYDAARVMADAIGRSKKLDGPDLRDAIAATKNFKGVTGNITIGPDRNAVGKKIVIEEVKNGQLTLKAVIEPVAGGTAMPATATH